MFEFSKRLYGYSDFYSANFTIIGQHLPSVVRDAVSVQGGDMLQELAGWPRDD